MKRIKFSGQRLAVKIRLSKKMMRYLHKCAAKIPRSVNAEIVQRLERSVHNEEK